MKYNNRFIKVFILFAVVLSATLQGCSKKLDLFPTNATTSETVFTTPTGYRQALAKVYASMAVTGSPTRDIPAEIVNDEGNTAFLRQFWYLQCLSTDEGGWTYSGNTDPLGIHQMTWSSSTQAVAGSYYRSLYNITLCNNFIIESADDKISSRGISGADADNIRKYRNEARFIRAFNYWVLMDLFGNVPFVTEATAIGSTTLPTQIKRADLFAYIESELLSMEAGLADAKSNEFGRVDKAAAWSLLARMYLNAAVYTGKERYTDAITYANKVIGGGYSLENNYKYLMLADNHLNTNEFIWSILFDGTNIQSYGGTTFLVHAPAGVSPDSSGTNGTWDCMRITQQFVNKFDAQDVRGQFWTSTQIKNMDTLLGAPRNGYSSTKFRNKTRSGAVGPHIDAGRNFADVDFPVFRLAEMYLIYAEAVIRGGSGGSNATALGYLRQLAARARPGDQSAANYPQMTLQYIIDERGRELFWEGHRRTDLIRFGQFTTSTYLWAWKGGVRNGTAVDNKYNLYPIPATDLSSNPNLVQTAGY
jgi:hypothetical protein